MCQSPFNFSVDGRNQVITTVYHLRPGSLNYITPMQKNTNFYSRFYFAYFYFILTVKRF